MPLRNSEDATRTTGVIKDAIKDAIEEALTDGQPSNAFCKSWPSAKAALEELVTQLNSHIDPEAPITDANNAAIKSLVRCIESVITLGEHFFEKCGQTEISMV